MMQKLRSNKEGFTLIELMIVIAIIGILAAIAIPNFIAYRNKAYCTQAETDAANTAAAISDFYSEPQNTRMVTLGDLQGVNTAGVTLGGSVAAITVTVADPGSCPRDGSFLLTIPATAGDGWQ